MRKTLQIIKVNARYMGWNKTNMMYAKVMLRNKTFRAQGNSRFVHAFSGNNIFHGILTIHTESQTYALRLY